MAVINKCVGHYTAETTVFLSFCKTFLEWDSMSSSVSPPALFLVGAFEAVGKYRDTYRDA